MTEFVSGGSLDTLLYDSTKSLTLYQSNSIALGCARGIAHLHAQSIVHRDIAARNILIEVQGADRIAKVTDFGMARVDEAAQTGALENQTSTKVGPIK